MKHSVEHLLERARMAIEGASNHPEALKKLSRHGYDAKKMQEGKALCEKVKMYHTLKRDGYGSQKKATKEFKAIRKAINETYRYHLSVARLALRSDSSLWDTLQLKGPRQVSIPKWLEQVQAFYHNIDRVIDNMEERGVSKPELDQIKAMMEAAADMRIKQAYSKSEAQQATQQRNQAVQELRAWLSDFLYVARFALKENGQQLEALGLVVSA